MTQRIRNSLLIPLSLLLLTASGCTIPQTNTSSSPIEITDQLGRLVRLDKIPERIVSLAPSNTEILYALGLDEKVVGVTDYCNYPPEVKEKPGIGGFSTPDIERIVALAPDLILATSIHQKQVIPNLEQRGMTAFVLAPKTLDEVLEAITLVGKLTGKKNEASGLVAGMQTRIKAVTGKTASLPEAPKTTVFYVTWHDPLKTAGSGTLQDELIRMVGGVNIAGDLSGYPGISLEAVVLANPEVIIAGVGMGTGADAPLQFAQTDSRLRDTAARRNDRVYAMDVDIVGRTGPRIVDALEQFARYIHPELFEEAK
ncbi:MAG: cobalamin-binding protein [Dehalococcoidales bacterium]|nr:cobalamin-binding protein [Dehalococcoidales bacterium]